MTLSFFHFGKKEKSKASRKRISSSEFHGYDDYFYIELESENGLPITLEYSKTIKRSKQALLTSCLRGVGSEKTPVTVKCIRKPVSKRNSLAMTKLSKEATLFRRLKHHRNIVGLIEVIDDPNFDKIFLVYEQMDFPPVAMINEDGYLMPSTKTIIIPEGHGEDNRDMNIYLEFSAKHIFRQIVDALRHIHSKRIAHRDINVFNVLLDSDSGLVKLCNFGFSQLPPDSDEDVLRTHSFVCPQRCAMLTNEHNTFEHDEEKSDIWSIGVLLYLMVVGKLPFRGFGSGDEYICSLYHCIQSEEPHIPSRLDFELQDLLLRLLQKKIEKRISLPELMKHPWLGGDERDAASCGMASPDEGGYGELASPTKEEIAFTVKKSIRQGIAKLLGSPTREKKEEREHPSTPTQRSLFNGSSSILPYGSSGDLHIYDVDSADLEQ